jgi:hypothetical protein
MKVCGKDIAVRGRLIRIAGLAADTYEFLEDPESALDALRGAGVRIDLFTFMQRLPHTAPKYGYLLEWDNFAAVPVSTFDQWWTGQINNKTRNMVRKAEKMGVTLREVAFDDTLVQGIHAIYNECAVRQGKPFAHFGKDIETVRRQAGTFLDRSIFVGAFFEGTLIGFAKLLCDETRTQAGLVHIVSMVRHRDKAPTNALVAQAVRSCAERRIPYLVYSRFSDGNRERDALTDFKEHNGFQRIDVPRYFVPLSLAGRAALRFGLHRGLSVQIPERVKLMLRKIRTSWYNRRFQTATS